MSDLNGEDHDSVERILGAGRHLLALINEIIDIARIESGDLNLSLEPVAVRSLIDETARLFSPLAAEQSITISHNCSHPHLTARADQQRLSQVLVNLLSNAVKYNRRNGTVTITSQPHGTDQFTVVIADTGPGLTDDDLERIFVPFERLDASQTSTEGTGIGLPLAKALTEAMGGTLNASSVLGHGSDFTIVLPRAPDVTYSPPRHTPPASPPRISARTARTLNILYIEDNPANVEVLARFARSRPNTTLQSATTGVAGIETAVRDIPDIIILDLNLGDLHGIQVLHQLKSEPETLAIPVVILSADATPGAIRRLSNGGAHTYLTKPVDLAQLGRLLDSLNPAPNHQARSATPTTAT
jgi:CheY-like chemotaxis protein/two-component sensor histidine kinase